MQSAEEDEGEEEQSLKLALVQSWIWSDTNFIFLASASKGARGQSFPQRLIFSLTVHGQCIHHLLSSLWGAGEAEIYNQISALAGIWTPSLLIGSQAR